MKRRGLFAVLFAPLLTRLAPKPKQDTGAEYRRASKIWQQYRSGRLGPSTGFEWYAPQQIEESEKDFDFLAGVHWTEHGEMGRPALMIDHLTPAVEIASALTLLNRRTI